MCLVALERDVGVDVEHIERAAEYLKIAERNFSPDEVTGLRALEPKSRTRRFFEFWTLKEAFIKAMGIGVSLGLDRVSFQFDDHEIRATFDSSLEEQAENWQFQLFGIGTKHVAAACLRRVGGIDAKIRSLAALPLLAPGRSVER